MGITALEFRSRIFYQWSLQPQIYNLSPELERSNPTGTGTSINRPRQDAGARIVPVITVATILIRLTVVARSPLIARSRFNGARVRSATKVEPSFLAPCFTADAIVFVSKVKILTLTVAALSAIFQLCHAQEQGLNFTIAGNLYLIDTVQVASEDPGIIRSVVKVGQAIKSGQPIARLNDEIYAAQRAAAEKELAAAKLEAGNDVDQQFAKVSADVSRRVLERSIAANQQYRKAVSQTEIERLKLELKRSELSGEQADRTNAVNRISQHLKSDALKIANLRLENRHVRCPIDGIVTEVNTQVGQWVNAGQTIAKVVNPRRLRFAGLADREELLPNEIQETAVLTVEFQGGVSENFDVAITFISPEIDPSSGFYEVHAEVDNAQQRLFAGMRAQLTLRWNQ